MSHSVQIHTRPLERGVVAKFVPWIYREDRYIGIEGTCRVPLLQVSDSLVEHCGRAASNCRRTLHEQD